MSKKVIKMQKKYGPVLNVAEDCVEVFKKSGYKKVAEKAVDIDKMKKAQLKTYAKENGIDIEDANTEDEIRTKIKAAEEAEV